ncbi:hypothetical protein [Paenibacillus sp. R14(2021)]|nr:hypothetical protein [Paenibacillus sp. R14(2021)]
MRILLAEDDEMLGELTEHQLKRHYYVVDHTQTMFKMKEKKEKK